MTLALCMSSKKSGDVDYWYADVTGEVLHSDSLPMPLSYESQKYPENQVNICFFDLQRDDDSLLPVYSPETPVLKIMTIFSEFVSCIAELTQKLELQFVCFKLSEHLGSFELQTSGNPSVKTLGLLQTGLGILSYTRGFQMTNFRSSLSKTVL